MAYVTCWHVVLQLQDKENAFFVADLSDIVDKFRVWKCLLPRVQPFYGETSHVDALSEHQSIVVVASVCRAHFTSCF